MPPVKKGGPQPARGTKLTLSVGLVNVPVKIAPLVRSTSISGKRICPCHSEPIKSQSICATTGEMVEPVTGFEYDGRFVTGVDRADHKAERDGRLELTGTVELDTLDPLYFDKSYVLWPQDGQEASHDLIAELLRTSGKALIGKTVLTSSTRVIAIRWSDATGTLVAHSINYDEAIAWNDVGLVKAGLDSRPSTADESAIALGEQLLATLTGDLDFGAVRDEYAGNLAVAIEAAAQGLPAPAPAEAAPAPAAIDLMDALRASVEQSKPKAKTRKKVTA
jgi:DNA end-binding protein Ku